MAPPTKTSIMLVSGEYFDPYAPDPSVVTLDVLAAGLARINRFKGQTLRAIPVGEHCMRVARLAPVVQRCRGLVVDRPLGLDALLHDAHEALTPWGDVPSPLKTDDMRALEKSLDVVVYQAIGLPMPDPQVRQVVELADMLALYFEAMLWAPGASDWAPNLLSLVWQALDGRVQDRSDLIDLTLPMVAPRHDECWHAEIHRLLLDRPTSVGIGPRPTR